MEGSDFWPPDRERGRIKEWYEGKWNELGPNSIFLGYRERHWTANLVRASVRFYLAHWKWIWLTLIGAIATLVGLLNLLLKLSA